MGNQTFIEQLAGATVVSISPMSENYREENGWSEDSDQGVTIEFSNGIQIHSQSDPEASRPGHMVFEDTNGERFHLFKGE